MEISEEFINQLRCQSQARAWFKNLIKDSASVMVKSEDMTELVNQNGDQIEAFVVGTQRPAKAGSVGIQVNGLTGCDSEARAWQVDDNDVDVFQYVYGICCQTVRRRPK